MRLPGFPDDGGKEGGGLANVSALSVKSMDSHICMPSSYHNYTTVVLEPCWSLVPLVTSHLSFCLTIAKLSVLQVLSEHWRSDRGVEISDGLEGRGLEILTQG
jgi:hypothetical protein